ncbi:hypothetical protein VTO42DRAFT_2858 [Malbranchea cinnamomea]
MDRVRAIGMAAGRLHRRPLFLSRALTFLPARYYSQGVPPIVSIKQGTFYREYPQGGGEQQNSNNPPLFRDVTFDLPRSSPGQRFNLAVIGSSGKADFLNILRGQLVCLPPLARSYPYLATDQAKGHLPSEAIRYVGFNNDVDSTVRGAYLSARYESRREETDWTVMQYLRGETSLNPLEGSGPRHSEELLRRVIADLNLEKLVDMPVANLSHGQGRRLRIAKALLDEPDVLLLDEPFMGLDPATARSISELLGRLSAREFPQLVISLRPQDPIPFWITNVAILSPHNKLLAMDHVWRVRNLLRTWNRQVKQEGRSERLPGLSQSASSKDGPNQESQLSHTTTPVTTVEMREVLRDFRPTRSNSHALLFKPWPYGERIVEMEGVQVKYEEDGKPVLGGWRQGRRDNEGLYWTVRRNQRWGIFGSNGSGKTTLISLITSDHPQAYSQPVRLFGRSRLPEAGRPGISIFDLQARIGHSSPEIHAFFPRQLSVRAALESAWAETFLSKPALNPDRNSLVNGFLEFFEADLKPDSAVDSTVAATTSPETSSQSWADQLTFRDLSLAQQKLVLFLRAIIRKPDLVILDEALSGMSRDLRDKCLHFLEVGPRLIASTGLRRVHDADAAKQWKLPRKERCAALSTLFDGLEPHQALIVISHVKEEIPETLTHWMRLPGPEEDSSVFSLGNFFGRSSVLSGKWGRIWGDRSAGSHRGRGFVPPLAWGIDSAGFKRAVTRRAPSGKRYKNQRPPRVGYLRRRKHAGYRPRVHRQQSRFRASKFEHRKVNRWSSKKNNYNHNRNNRNNHDSYNNNK